MKTLLAKLLGISKQLLDWFWPVFISAAASSLEILLPIAFGIVTRLALDKSLSGAQKRDIAVKELGEAAKAQGVEAGLSVLNLAVETAVANLKAIQK